MDGQITPTDHSDSDSGESWTILENSPQYAEDIPDFPRDLTERLMCNEKDEDTDGISIISDSDHESAVFLKNNEERSIKEEIFTENPQSHISDTPQFSNLDKTLNLEESFSASDDFLLDSNGRLKTYVHRRNKRLSTILNIIMLGSVITAAGVAIGHMWGAKNDCVMHSTPSVNKILSNLYKLQEENAFLRSKLKELTLLGTAQKQQKIKINQQRCKKVFEEPLNSKSSKVTKCMDEMSIDDQRILESHLVEPNFEKEFVNDLNKVESVYEQNKHWLDDEIAKRLQTEEKYVQKRDKPPKEKPPFKENRTFLNENPEPFLEKSFILTESKTVDDKQPESYTVKKVSYADSVKIENKEKPKSDRKIENESKENVSKKKHRKPSEPTPEKVQSEEEIKKDDRYKPHKSKYNKKKTEKWRKKQAKRNRYEQFIINDQIKIFGDKNSNPQESDSIKTYQDNINDIRSTDSSENIKEGIDFEKNKSKIKTDGSNLEKEKSSWFEKRTTMRRESRKKLELELFGEKSLNDSGWYFRRMKRREQCRAKAYNSTHKKDSKLNMNFKVKY